MSVKLINTTFVQAAKSKYFFVEDLVQKLQQTPDIHISVHLLPEAGQAALLMGCLAKHQSLNALSALADCQQLRLQFLGQLRHFLHVATKGGQVMCSKGLPLSQLCYVKGGAGYVGR